MVLFSLAAIVVTFVVLRVVSMYKGSYSTGGILFIKNVYSSRNVGHRLYLKEVQEEHPQWGVFVQYKRWPWSRKESSMIVASRRSGWHYSPFGIVADTGEEIVVPLAVRKAIDTEIARRENETRRSSLQGDIDRATQKELKALGMGG